MKSKFVSLKILTFIFETTLVVFYLGCDFIGWKNDVQHIFYVCSHLVFAIDDNIF